MSVTITGTPRARWAHCGGMHICNIGRIAQCGAFLARLIRIAIIWKRRTIYYLRRCRPKMGLIAWWKRSGLKWTFWPFRNSISKMPTMCRLKYAKKTFFFSGACNDVGWEQNIITIYGNARLWKRHIKNPSKILHTTHVSGFGKKAFTNLPFYEFYDFAQLDSFINYEVIFEWFSDPRHEEWPTTSIWKLKGHLRQLWIRFHCSRNFLKYERLKLEFLWKLYLTCRSQGVSIRVGIFPT